MSDATAKKPEKTETVELPKRAGAPVGTIVTVVNSLLLVGVLVFMFLQLKQQTALLETLASPGKKPAAHAEEPAEHEPAGEGQHGEAAATEGHGAAPAAGEHGAAEGDHAAAAKEDKELAGLPAAKVGPLVKIPDFVVHLRNPDADRYARMSFDVEVFTEGDRDRLNSSMPRVRDAFIAYLSDRTLEDLRGSEGLGRTKDALQSTLRQLVPMVRIRALYISDFVVQ